MIFYKTLCPIKALTFDLDDTLYENTSVLLKAEQSLQEYMHAMYPVTESVDRHFWRELQRGHLKLNPLLRHDMGELRKRSLHSGLIKLGFAGKELEAATSTCYEHFYYQRSNFKVDQNIHSLLERLAKKVPLVAITNGNADPERIGLGQYFSKCFRASLSMPMKPDRTMFDAAQAHLNIPQKNILHVGDNLESDIFGALKAGYQTAWYAEDRTMRLNTEQASVVPHVQLHRLLQLEELV